jgi:hypothetical protein
MIAYVSQTGKMCHIIFRRPPIQLFSTSLYFYGSSFDLFLLNKEHRQIKIKTGIMKSFRDMDILKTHDKITNPDDNKRQLYLF